MLMIMCEWGPCELRHRMVSQYVDPERLLVTRFAVRTLTGHRSRPSFVIWLKLIMVKFG